MELLKDHQQLMEQYLDNLRRLNKSEHTINNYRADLKKFISWLESDQGLHLERVNGDIIGVYKEFLHHGGAIYEAQKSLKKYQFILWFQMALLSAFFKKRTPKSMVFFQRPLGVGSRRRHLSSIKNFFQYLKEVHEDRHQKFQKNPVKSKLHAIKLKDIDVDSTRLLKNEDYKNAFEKSFRIRDRLILSLLFYGGLRLSELCFLRNTDFDIETKTLTFIRKGGSIHRLKIKHSDQIFSLLKLYHGHQSSLSGIASEYLFHNKKGRPLAIKTMYNQVMKILERGGVDPSITPHSFRKACATNLYKETKDLLIVRNYLNHSDAKVTQTYIVV